MKKISNEERWNAAKEIASKIELSVEEIHNCKKEDIQPFYDVKDMPTKVSEFDGKDYDEEDTFEYFKTLISFHKAALK